MNSRRLWSFGGGIVSFFLWDVCDVDLELMVIIVNAGEVVQLVLKNPNTGVWLPFSFVLRVMIHELAHIKQMVCPFSPFPSTFYDRYLTFLFEPQNHSRAFWSVNNKFASQLRVLQAKGYTGEGFWSAGRTLLSEQYTHDQLLAERDMPKSLCGGSFL